MLARALLAAAALIGFAPAATAAETNGPNYPPSKETHGHFTRRYGSRI
jgi:Spy/CpxP family protein refolding chaperone